MRRGLFAVVGTALLWGSLVGPQASRAWAGCIKETLEDAQCAPEQSVAPGPPTPAAAPASPVAPAAGAAAPRSAASTWVTYPQAARAGSAAGVPTAAASPSGSDGRAVPAYAAIPAAGAPLDTTPVHGPRQAQSGVVLAGEVLAAVAMTALVVVARRRAIGRHVR